MHEKFLCCNSALKIINNLVYQICLHPLGLDGRASSLDSVSLGGSSLQGSGLSRKEDTRTKELL